MLDIKDLHVLCEGNQILNGFTLTINKGEIHALMGPNGAGKSTLAKVLAGHPDYEVVSGSISFMGQDLLELEPEERALLGLFVSFQYPPEIAGISNEQFLLHAYNAKRKSEEKEALCQEEFAPILDQKMEAIQMRDSFKKRSVNEGFSGGEKKRNEILQMALLEPAVAILDETDSGLDIDALRTIATGVKELMGEERGLLLITHYQRLLDYIKPDYVHVLIDGQIVESGDATLAQKLEERGYEHYLLESML